MPEPIEATGVKPIEAAQPWEGRLEGKPAISAFGYLSPDGPKACSRYQLLELCLSQTPPPLVWTPEHAELRLPGQVDFIREAVARSAKQPPGSGVVPWTMGGIAVLTFLLGLAGIVDIAWGIVLLVVLVPGAVAIALVRRSQYRKARAAILAAPAELQLDLSHAGYGSWLQEQPLRITRYLAFGLGALMLAQYLAGLDASIQSAGLVKPAVRAGEYWRLLSAALLHGHWLHFWFNFGALIAFGRLVEVHAGRAYVGLVFLLAALGGSVASTLLIAAPSIGASGGIIGLLGFLLLVARRRPAWFPPGMAKSIWSVVVSNAVIGALGFAFIDNAAHGGGFLVGAALGQWLPLRTDDAVTGEAPPALGWAGAASVAILGVAAVLTLIRLLAPMVQPYL